MERRKLAICTVVGILGLVAAVLGFAAEGKRIKLYQSLEWSLFFTVLLPGIFSSASDKDTVHIGPHMVIRAESLLSVRFKPLPRKHTTKATIGASLKNPSQLMQGSQVQITSPSECIYPRSPALGLGLTAAVALMVAQIIINVSTGCVCCRRGRHHSNSNRALALVCFIVSWFTFVIAFLLLLTGAALNDQHGEENIYFGSYYCYVVKPGVFAGAAVLSLASVALGILYYLTLTSTKNTNLPTTWGGPAPPGQTGIVMGQPQFPPPGATQDPVFVHEDTYNRRQVA